MIEPTDEMIEAFERAAGRAVGRDSLAGMAAVLAIVEREQQRCQWCNTSAGHRYLSTGCLHGEHDYCRSMTGYQGEKRPSQCKFCEAKCVCPCHADGGS